MASRGREPYQRTLAVIVIVAMLALMGIPWPVIIFLCVISFFVWRAVQHTEHRDVGRIFEFYIQANEILRDEDRHWYGFEVAEVIALGEDVLHTMSDPPPLVYFTLGALYGHAGDHEAAADHLSYVIENDLSDERHRHTPSADLRRYVVVLRKLEREPAEAPQTLAAIRCLERMRRTSAESLLELSRERLGVVSAAGHLDDLSRREINGGTPGARPTRQFSYPAPPSITEVLHDVYEEEKRTA